ncbi:MAG: hypothetical protein OXF61_04215 [Acidimicrobiaceae bacterium]|nr:hypothetical protein [Acidimicrobiaceae bacterium]
MDYIVVGSTAAAAWGAARMTRDVDIVVLLAPDSGETVLEALRESEVYFPESDARRAVTSGGSFNILHPTSGGKVDVFAVPSEDAFTQSRIARRVRTEVLGIETWIAAPEDVVLAKLRWRLESRSEVQWRDCVEIAAINDLDVSYMHRWASALGIQDDLTELLAEQA